MGFGKALSSRRLSRIPLRKIHNRPPKDGLDRPGHFAVHRRRGALQQAMRGHASQIPFDPHRELCVGGDNTGATFVGSAQRKKPSGRQRQSLCGLQEWRGPCHRDSPQICPVAEGPFASVHSATNQTGCSFFSERFSTRHAHFWSCAAIYPEQNRTRGLADGLQGDPTEINKYIKQLKPENSLARLKPNSECEVNRTDLQKEDGASTP